MENMKKNQQKELMENTEHFLSPSKINCFLKCKHTFIRRYVLKERPKETKPQSRGKELHELFYKILRKEVTPDNIMPIPDYGNRRLKANKEKEQEFIEYCAERSIVPLAAEDFLIAEQMFLFVYSDTKLGKELQNVKSDDVEKDMYMSHIPLKGIPDMILETSTIDIKTTSKTDFLNDVNNFIKFQEKSLAIQDMVYNQLTGKRTHFLVFTTAYPYGGKLITLSESFREDIKKLLYESYIPKTLDFMEKTAQQLGRNPFPSKEYNGKSKFEDMKKLFTSPDLHVAVPSQWVQKDIDLELGIQA